MQWEDSASETPGSHRQDQDNHDFPPIQTQLVCALTRTRTQHSWGVDLNAWLSQKLSVLTFSVYRGHALAQSPTA